MYSTVLIDQRKIIMYVVFFLSIYDLFANFGVITLV